jgi:hypothetical protein
MARQGYIATIQIAIECDSEAQACNGISECLADEAILDWQYLKLGGQFLSPTSKLIQNKYTEGDAFK